MDENRTGTRGFTLVGMTPDAAVEGGHLSVGAGLLMQVRNAMGRLQEGQVLEVQSSDEGIKDDLKAWCQLTLNEFLGDADAGGHGKYFIRKGEKAARADQPDWGVRLLQRDGGEIDMRDWFVGRAGRVPEGAPTYLGFVPRGAVPELGMPEYPYTLNNKADVWADNVVDLFEQAKAQQWNATTDIPWARLKPLPEPLERAVCQLMTFLAENEYAALYIPAKFLPRINAQYVEVILFLGTVINDEARHIEAFTKRALANGGGLQYSAALTEWSLHSLLVQEDYFRSSFLLHVLGEGTFLELLDFIEKHAPDPATREVVRRARLDEGRHVAYGLSHVRECLQREATRADELVEAAEERSAALQASSGSNPMVMEALAVLAGGGSSPTQMARGFQATRELYQTMHEYRVRRMLQIGLDRAPAEKIAGLHTPNFM